MAELIGQRRYPAEMMARISKEDEKVGPYRPCPCGSGRKFRFCHGDRAPLAPFSRVDARTALPASAPGARP
jgi:uncharacterized protein